MLFPRNFVGVVGGCPPTGWQSFSKGPLGLLLLLLLDHFWVLQTLSLASASGVEHTFSPPVPPTTIES